MVTCLPGTQADRQTGRQLTNMHIQVIIAACMMVYDVCTLPAILKIAVAALLNMRQYTVEQKVLVYVGE